MDTITADREAWLATMMDEERHLQPVQTPAIAISRAEAGLRCRILSVPTRAVLRAWPALAHNS